MADFRRCLYALALVALLAGLTIPASAQTFNCTNTTGVPPTVRAEGFAELVGDLIIDCTGGVPTPPGQLVPQVNIAINLDTYVSSKVTAVVNSNTEFLESLLIVDEPNSPTNPTRVIRNCGAANEDSTAAGPGVCNIFGGGSLGAANSYDGTCVTAATCHPNVFQGRSLALINGQTNQVLFLGIPIDPPGTQCPAATANPGAACHRIIRITNIRGDASQTGVAQGNQTSSITAQIIANPVSGLPVDIPTHIVARVQLGLVQSSLTNGTVAGGKFDFVQCSLLFDNPLSGNKNNSQNLTFTFREAFANAFKPRTVRQTLNNGSATPYAYTGAGVPTPSVLTPNVSNATTLNQNVPGATYDTESGFMNPNAAPAGGNPPTNPLTAGPGIGNAFVDTNQAPGSTTAIDPAGNNVGFGTGITSAGIATQGTRLILNFTNVPTGSSIAVPTVVLLTNVVTNLTTGVAVLVTGTAASGSGGTPTLSGTVVTTFPPATTAAAQTCFPVAPAPNCTGAGEVLVAGSQVPGGALPLSQRAVYEIFFANPGAVEQVAIPMTVLSTCSLGTAPTSPCPNLPGNLPAPNSVARVQGGFAPFYAPALNVRTAAIEGQGIIGSGAENLTTTPARLPVPRFQNLNAPVDLFSVVRCSCNLLFPFVTNQPTAGGNFDTGIAIVNTSLDPGNTAPNGFGFRGSAQTGPVQLWYYNRNASPATVSTTNPTGEPNLLSQGNTQCTNVTTPGSCSGTLTTVPAGGMLTYVLSSGGGIQGATPAGNVLVGVPGFQGYIIAQAGFQYCHGFAFISKQGAGFQADNLAMGYLALVLDPPGLPRTFSLGENDAH
jgi:hypothetical protein